MIIKNLYFLLWSFLIIFFSITLKRPWFFYKQFLFIFQFFEPKNWSGRIVKRKGLKWRLRYNKDHVSRAFIYNNGIYEGESYELVMKKLQKPLKVKKHLSTLNSIGFNNLLCTPNKQ
tara:strand:- start:425 stop:775 length:351 start_codon:yes stop_codon:yes gene_type:complete